MTISPRSSAEDEDLPVRVLLAEDEESFIQALEIGLEREGFAVTVARDGAEAIELFRSEGFDLLLLDVMLPKVSGLDVCRAVRAVSSVPISIRQRGLILSRPCFSHMRTMLTPASTVSLDVGDQWRRLSSFKPCAFRSLSRIRLSLSAQRETSL